VADALRARAFRDLGQFMAEQAAELREKFTDPVRVTILVRNLAADDRDLIVTDDTLDGIETSLVRARHLENSRG
jgi:hypothetical protein